MKSKAEVINDVLKYGWNLPPAALKKLKKKELQVLLNKYKKPEETNNKKETKPVNVTLRDFTDSENEEDNEQKENKGFTVTFKTGKNDDDKLPDKAPVLKKQNGFSKKNIQTEIKRLVNNFSLFISDIIKQFRDDNDAEYVVSNYNVHRSDVETEITDYLHGVDAEDSLYDYANELLKIQQNRIEKLLGMK